jgi:GAF domain-containing protein
MRSRTARLSCGVVAWIAIGASALFLIRSEKQLASLRADGRAFDLHAREVTDALSDLRAAQQAYVAAGQGVAFWMPKVAQTADAINASIATLQKAGTSSVARSAIDEAVTTLAEFAEVDKRARDYLRSGQLLMAGDVIFTEGDQTAASAARQVEAARLAEHQALDASEASVRKQEALALTGAGVATAVIVMLLGVIGSSEGGQDASLSLRSAEASASSVRQAENHPSASRAVSPILKTAAQLCTDFACMRDVYDLQQLLARASDVMDAAGLVVWLGNADGAELQPVLSHGYNDATRARLPNVPRAADNAAAAAYRSGDVQIVQSRPGGAKGAIVAPILGTHGCIGALSAEIRGGGEASESVQALAAIVAAQLAGVLGAPPAESSARAAASS